MYTKELAECRIIGFIVRKRGRCTKSEARHDVAHKLITATAIEAGFLNEGDLYIEPVSAEVLLVKSTHQLSVCVGGVGDSFHQRGERTVQPQEGRK